MLVAAREHYRRNRITEQEISGVRWALVQATYQLCVMILTLGVFFERVVSNKVCRRLLLILLGSWLSRFIMY
jgi:hypothetical protein